MDCKAQAFHKHGRLNGKVRTQSGSIWADWVRNKWFSQSEYSLSSVHSVVEQSSHHNNKQDMRKVSPCSMSDRNYEILCQFLTELMTKCLWTIFSDLTRTTIYKYVRKQWGGVLLHGSVSVRVRDRVWYGQLVEFTHNHQQTNYYLTKVSHGDVFI